jgi:hypothetical protein
MMPRTMPKSLRLGQAPGSLRRKPSPQPVTPQITARHIPMSPRHR